MSNKAKKLGQVFTPEWIVNEILDASVRNKPGIYAYVLGGKSETNLLDVRIFSDAIKQRKCRQQTEEAQAKGVSNCPLCAISNNANKTRIYTATQMEADHVTAWSKGGDTSLENCEMLCVVHNRAKGNK